MVKNITDEEKLLQMYMKIRKSGIRQKEIARKMDVSPAMLSLYLSGQCNMSQKNIDKLNEIINNL